MYAHINITRWNNCFAASVSFYLFLFILFPRKRCWKQGNRGIAFMTGLLYFWWLQKQQRYNFYRLTNILRYLSTSQDRLCMWYFVCEMKVSMLTYSFFKNFWSHISNTFYYFHTPHICILWPTDNQRYNLSAHEQIVLLAQSPRKGL